ncbi:MAG: hypothetical protein LBP25_04675 [Tannerellaceae bacterium]|nr:hypothetical protein [Tannerellaceae bacterium]
MSSTQKKDRNAGEETGHQEASSRPRSSHCGLIGVNPETMGVNPKAVGVNPEAVGVNPEAMGVDPGAVGVNPEAVGVNPEAVGVNPGAVGVNPGAVGVNPGAVGVNPKPPENSSRNTGSYLELRLIEKALHLCVDREKT